MTNHAGPLYEVSLTGAGDVLAEVDTWLEEIARTAPEQDGIENARIFEFRADEAHRDVRTCQFQVRDDHSLDELLDGYFADIDAQAAEKFGEQVLIESRTLRADHSHDLLPNESPLCLNCDTRLRGQYCGNCGQRSRSRLISIWQLLREAFGDLLELDSRLWRTTLPLLIRPGQLTRDYLEGRRARYMPPFRTYLVLSVIFFVVAFFDPKDDLSLFFEPQPEPTAEEIAEREDNARIAVEEKDAQLDDEDGIFGDCENASISDEEDMPEWVKKRFTDERIKHICEKNKARGNDNFADAILDNIPVALIVLLPIMAMVLKLLYPLSRRYFVEHLLFFVHFHAFFFLILTLQILFARLANSLSFAGIISTLILVATSFYIPVYLYKAMRHVYGQGHAITIFKYLMLSIAYLTGATITMLGAFFVAVLSA